MKPKQKFYDVTMRVEVTRRVLACSEGEAHEKVDTEDMIHEIKTYKVDEEIIIKEDAATAPDIYDMIEDLGEQIVRNSHAPMYRLKEQYAEIRELNDQLAKAGKPTYEPFIFNRMTDGFLEALRSE